MKNARTLSQRGLQCPWVVKYADVDINLLQSSWTLSQRR